MSDHALGLRLRQLLVAQSVGPASAVPAGSPQAPPLPDGRRLQALVGDLCRQDQQDLLPPLRHLVLAPAFQSALRTTPPLADPRCRQRLMQELRAVFTPALCQRMEAVVDGLLGLDAQPRPAAEPPQASAGPPWGAVAAQPAPAAAEPIARREPIAGHEPIARSKAIARGEETYPREASPAGRPRRGVSPLLLAGAMAAALAVGVGLARLWWEAGGLPGLPGSTTSDGAGSLDQGAQDPRVLDPRSLGPRVADPRTPGLGPGEETGAAAGASPDPFAQAPAPAPGPAPERAGSSRLEGAPQPGESASPAEPQPPPLPPLPSAGSGAGATAPGAASDGASTTAATSQVQQLYASLSRQDFSAARGYFSAEVADQFDPAFFRQFARVEVAGLQPTARSATTLTLRGVVRFVYPDGSSQLESRRFTLSTLDNPPRVIGSAFEAVLRPRGTAP
jgi:hypothetical protein